jgi:hypothetical protein
VVIFSFDQPRYRIRVVIDYGARFAQGGGWHAEFVDNAAGCRNERRLGGIRVTAAAIGPDAGRMIFGHGPALEQQPIALVKEEYGKSAVKVPW